MSDTRSDEIETTIGQLPANGTLADTDAIPTEKSGGSGVKTTLAQIKTFIQNAFNSVFAKKTDLDDYAKSSDLSSYAKTSDVADTYETKANASSTYASKTSLNDCVKNTFQNALVVFNSNNFNDFIQSGFYRIDDISTFTNAPASNSWGQLIVSRNGDTVLQLYIGYGSTQISFRCFSINNPNSWNFTN